MKNNDKKISNLSKPNNSPAARCRFLPQPARFRQTKAGQAAFRLLITCLPLPRIEGKRQKQA